MAFSKDKILIKSLRELKGNSFEVRWKMCLRPIAYNFSYFVIYLPKITKIDLNLTKL